MIPSLVPSDEGFSLVVFVFVPMVFVFVPTVFASVPMVFVFVPTVFVSVPMVFASVPTEKVFGRGKKSSVGWLFFPV